MAPQFRFASPLRSQLSICINLTLYPPSLLSEDGDIIKAHLQRLTGRSTFPNVMIQTRSIGGSDDIDNLHRQGMFEVLLKTGGIQVHGN